MTSSYDDTLEKDLAAMTAWHEPAPQLWKKALSITGKDRRQGLFSHSPLFRRWALAAAVVAALVIPTVLLLPELNQARTRNLKEFTGPVASVTPSAEWNSSSFLRMPDPSRDGDDGGGGLGRGGGGSDIGGDLSNNSANMHSEAVQRYLFSSEVSDSQQPGRLAPSAANGGDESGQRQVVRKATIELTSKDVRATFLKAAMLISEAGGEFVQDSAISGDGNTASATLTLRVSAARLPSVLNELRALGTVRSENQNGEDVTTQVVDVDARLRNEQRVETELLELLVKRNDAPLKEILELRQQINSVRQGIEQMTAQRERLGRLVSLATVLVIVRPEVAAPVEEKKTSSIGAYFSGAVSDSWSNGLRFLADSLAWIVNVLVGGAIWWIVVIVCLLLLREHLRRSARMAATQAAQP